MVAHPNCQQLMAKKLSTKNAEVVDVPADDPVGTMNRFAEGLRVALKAQKLRAPKPTRIVSKSKMTAPR